MVKDSEADESELNESKINGYGWEWNTMRAKDIESENGELDNYEQWKEIVNDYFTVISSETKNRNWTLASQTS